MPTVYLSPVSNAQVVLASNALPANAGLINTYLAGTTTPAATYTTSAGTIQNANPIVLTPAGLPPAEIWIPAGVSMKFVVTDLLGTQIGPTYDNLLGINDPAGSGGATGIPYTAPGSGAIVTTVSSDLNNQLINVQRYGAKGDGATDDTAAIQNAINYVQSIRTLTSSGGILYFPPGFYIISSGLSITGPINIMGCGTGLSSGTGNSGGSVIRCATNSVDFFTCNTSQAVVFLDMTISSTQAIPGKGIVITQTGSNINRRSRIERCNILACSTGISFQNVANYTIRDNFIQDFTGDGIYHTGTASSPDLGDAIIDGNTVWDLNVTTGDACIRLDPGAAVNVIGNKLLGANYGVRLTVSQGPTGTLNIVGNSMEQQNTACISGEQTVAGKTYGNVCISANELSILSPITTAIAAIRFPAAGGGQYLSNVTIQGNVCNVGITTSNPIISMQDGNGVSIVGNIVNNQGSVGATAGIDTGGNATNVVIDDNKVINMGGGATYTTGATLNLQPAHVHTFSSGGSTVGAGATVYLGTANSQATEGDAQFYIPFKCKAFRMFVNASAAPGGGQSFTYTLRVAGVASALTIANSGAGASDAQDITHAVSIPAPDGPSTAARISLQLVTSGGAAVTLHRVTVAFAKDD